MDNLDYNSLISAVIGFFGAIIGAIVGGFVSYYGSYKLNEKQSKDELKNIAKALDNDIYTISKSVNFETFYKLYKKGA
jgi:gas vesicle protein